jgi:hypothetical protein
VDGPVRPDPPVLIDDDIRGDDGRPLQAVDIPPTIIETAATEAPPSTFRGGSLREDDVRAHPDLYPFLSRRPSHSTEPLPELVQEYAYFSRNEYDDGKEDDEDVEELAESERQAIEQEFGPEDSLFEDVLSEQASGSANSGYGNEQGDIQKVEMAQGMTEEEMRRERSRLMAEEYERNCGAIWTEYRACLQVGFG